MAAITAAILGGLAIAQTVIGVSGARKAAKSAKSTANFEAGTLEQQATDVINIGEETANRTGDAARSLTGAQRVSQAAQGIDLSSGSAADVRANDQALSAEDERNIRLNAARQALGLRQQAEIVRQGGQNAAQSYNNQGISTALSGAVNLFDIYTKYGRNTSSTPRGTSGAQGTQGGFYGGKASP